MPTTLTSGEMKNLIVGRGLVGLRGDNIINYDDNYLLVDDAHCASLMFDLSMQTQNILGPWRSEYRDCDKFSRLLQGLAIADHARNWLSDGRTLPGGLAIGTLSYKPDSGGEHAVNLILAKVKGKDQINVRVFEPQSGEELFLSTAEKSSAFKLTI